MNVQRSQENVHMLDQEQTCRESLLINVSALQKASTDPSVSVMMADEHHLASTKQLSDKYKRELGFVNKEILRKAISTQSLIIALEGDTPIPVIGMVHFYVRRDDIVTLYSIAVAEDHRRRGIGQLLFNELVSVTRILGKNQIRLKCPTDLSANLFYQHLGLEKVTVEPGKRRPLNVWVYRIENEPLLAK